MIILGLFDQLADAREVLGQLASAPLDTDALEVIHRRPDVQAELMALGGIRPSATLPLAAAVGALLGGALGIMAAGGALAALSPLLAAAAGVLAGGAIGLAAGALSRRLRLPEPHAGQILDAIEGGATAIVVRTTNAANARVLAELFARNGSRQLEPLAERTPTEEAAGAAGDDAMVLRPPAPAASYAGRPTLPMTPSGSTSAPGPAPSSRAASLLARLRGGRQAKPSDETLFAPPWRRGVPASGSQPEPWPPAAGEPMVYAPPAASEPSDFAPSGGSVPAVYAPISNQPPVFTPPTTYEAPPAVTWGTFGVAAREDRDLAALGLSSRVAGALVMEGITTVSELRRRLEQGADTLLDVRGIGPAALEEIRRKLAVTRHEAPPEPEVDLISSAPPPLDILDATGPEAAMELPGAPVGAEAWRSSSEPWRAPAPIGAEPSLPPADPAEPSWTPARPFWGPEPAPSAAPSPPAARPVRSARHGFRPAVQPPRDESDSTAGLVGVTSVAAGGDEPPIPQHGERKVPAPPKAAPTDAVLGGLGERRRSRARGDSTSATTAGFDGSPRPTGAGGATSVDDEVDWSHRARKSRDDRSADEPA